MLGTWVRCGSVGSGSGNHLLYNTENAQGQAVNMAGKVT